MQRRRSRTSRNGRRNPAYPPAPDAPQGTAADRWDFWGQYNPDFHQGTGGFTEGIEKLNRVFTGSYLEWPARGELEPEIVDALMSLWQRGIRQLQDPDLVDYYGDLFDPEDPGQIYNFAKLPLPMVICLTHVVFSNAEGGRLNQRLLDMHTQYQGGVQMAEIQAGIREAMGERGG